MWGVLVVRQPPSPLVRFLLAWKLQAATSLSEPSLPLVWIPPWAWAASSITSKPRRLAMALMASMSAGRPPKWTGMMARVLGLTAGSTSAGSRL